MRRFLRRLLWLLLPPAGVLLVGLAILRNYYHGDVLAKLVTERYLNPHFRGRVVLKSIEWPLWEFSTGLGTMPVTITGIEVYDPTGKRVLRVDRAHGSLRWWELIDPWGKGDILVDKISIEPTPRELAQKDPPWVLIEEYPNPRESGVTVIGLVDAFEPRFSDPSKPHSPGSVIDIGGMALKGVHVELDFYVFRGVLENANLTKGRVRNSSRRKERDFFFETHDIVAGPGWIGVRTCDTAPTLPTRPNCLPEEEVRVDFDKAWAQRARIPQDDQRTFAFEARAVATNGTRTKARGTINGLWVGGGDINVTAEFENAGAMFEQLSVGVIGSGAPHGTMRIDGKFREPVFHLDAKEVPVLLGPAHLSVLKVSWAKETGEGILTNVVAQTLGGELEVQGPFRTAFTPKMTLEVQGPFRTAFTPKMTLEWVSLDLKVLRALALDPWIRPQDLSLLGGAALTGNAHIEGAPLDLMISPLLAQLGMAQATGRVRVVEGVGETPGLRIILPGAKGVVSGMLDPVEQRLSLALQLQVDRLGPWTTRLGAPEGPWTHGGSAEINAKIAGSFDAPTVSANLDARDVPAFGRVQAQLTYAAKLLSLTQLSAEPLEGRLSGRGRIHLGDRPRLEAVHLSADGLRIQAWPGIDPAFSGLLSFSVGGSGATHDYEAELQLSGRNLVAWDQPLGDLRTHLRLSESGVVLHSLHLGGVRGMSLDIVGQVRFDGDLDLKLDLVGLPLALVPGLGPDGVLPIEGTGAVRAKIEGTTRTPQVTGQARFTGVSVGETLLGGARIDLKPWPQGRVHVAGNLFQGKLTVDGSIGLLPPFQSSLRITFRRLEIDELAPEIARLLGLSGWLTGEVEIVAGPKLQLTARIETLRLRVEGEDAQGRPAPVTIRNRTQIEVSYDDGVLTLLSPMSLFGDDGQGSLELAGRVARTGSDLTMNGTLRFGLLDFLTRSFAEEVEGKADVSLRLRGDVLSPTLEGRVDLRRTRIRPRDAETELVIPQGTISFADDRLSVENLTVQADGETLVLAGTLDLPQFRPGRLDARLSGRLPAKLLALVDPASVSSAEGSAQVEIAVTGTWQDPVPSGLITFDREFEVALRGLRHDINVNRGKLRLSRGVLAVQGLGGLVDDATMDLEGDPTDCDAQGFCTAARLQRGMARNVVVSLRLISFTHRVPGILEAELTTQLVLRGDGQGLALTGNVQVVDGRFVQPFSIVDEFLTPSRVLEREGPFWEGQPLLENLRLGLQVSTNGTFLVQNNLADLTLDGSVDITGTLSAPRLDGQISIQSGKIRIPGFRASFTLRSGNMTFYRGKKMPEETPEIFLTAETDFEDRNKQRHLVTLRLSGPLGRLQPELWTDTGLNQAQTLNLLISGRSDADELLRGRDTTRDLAREGSMGSTSTLGGSSAFGQVADPFIKEVTGAFISNIIGDPLKKITKLDCVDIEPGIDSWRFYGCKDLSRNIRLEGEVEEGFAAGRIDRAGAKYQVHDNTAVDLTWQKDTPGEAESQEVRNRVRFQFKFRFVWQR